MLDLPGFELDNVAECIYRTLGERVASLNLDKPEKGDPKLEVRLENGKTATIRFSGYFYLTKLPGGQPDVRVGDMFDVAARLEELLK